MYIAKAFENFPAALKTIFEWDIMYVYIMHVTIFIPCVSVVI